MGFEILSICWDCSQLRPLDIDVKVDSWIEIYHPYEGKKKLRYRYIDFNLCDRCHSPFIYLKGI